MSSTNADAGPALGAVARTACWTAAARARESLRPDRLFDDPYAAAFAGELGGRMLDTFGVTHRATDDNPYLPVRTRWYDDFLRAAGLRQVVVLGAGFDARAFRLDWPDGTVLFELDRADLLAHKAAVLETGGARARCDRRPVAADLADDWPAALRAAGHDPAEPTAWIGEGLLFYLPEALARDVLGTAAALSACGSRLAADLICADKAGNAPHRAGFVWRFGTDEPARVVEECGWAVEAVLGPDQVGRRYGRWPDEPAPARRRSHLLTARVPGEAR
ncbi:SAM-dependent methyltransferase [Kitasatospora sp. NRRL B-11411]|uniref:SAM-dependent methyltransferase n=1 Tax=Kitasatospora sp. NRRL B-11411 TaxID=1463822 RepID=UPI0006918E24|nr:SAM-dependent methyltransferase [Kitasatospora sp. NRRL B-11411]